MGNAEVPDHYATLRLDRRASAQRVRQAYRRLAQRFHPDKHRGRGDSAGIMAEINRAYGVLSDADQRAAYDALLQQQLGPAPTRTRAAAMAAALQDPFGWAGWLLLVIALAVVLTLGYVALRMLVPTRPAFQVPVGAAAAPAVDTTPIAPVTPIQPWTEPPRTARPVNEATEPVARLVREGVVTPAPARARKSGQAQ